MPEEQRNLLLAVILSVAILAGWQFFIVEPERQAAQEAYLAQQAADPQAMEAAPASQLPVSQTITREAALKQTPRITLDNGRIKGSIPLQGLRIDDVTLTDYNKTVDPNSGKVELLSPAATEHAFFAEFGWLSAGNSIPTPGPESVWKSEAKRLGASDTIQLQWDNGQGVRFVRTITLDKDYVFTIKDEVVNNSAAALSLTPYALVNRKVEDHKAFFISHEGGLGSLDGVLTEITYDDMKEEERPVQYNNTRGWLGLSDKYWFAAVIPASFDTFDARFSAVLKQEQHRYQADLTVPPVTVEPGATSAVSYHLFAGAKEVSLIERYMEQLRIPLFDRSVDFGWLYFMTQPIFHALEFFYQYFGNFGLAILALTVIIKLLLFPIANKGYRSMSRLKDLNPKMIELRERYKDDKMALQKELIELYRREKITPMSGCMPILIQIPIFFALYKTLFITIEMRHAPFYGWIKDLSAPDPTSIFNLFGLLPYDVPSFMMIGAWPCIMALTMVIMQKLNPPPPDPIQRQMLALLPYIFVFLFASFPAGLVIYWAWSNTLSIIQQYVISRSARKEKAKARP